MMEHLVQESDQSYSMIGYYPDLIKPELLTHIKQYCETTPNYQGGHTNYGTEIPRLQKWYQQQGGYFSNRWHQRHPRWEAFPYDPSLMDIQSQVQTLVNQILTKHPHFDPHTFNSCLLNKYRHHQDSIREHSDDEPTFGLNPTVAVVSLGATRTIHFTRRLPGPTIRADPKATHQNLSLPLADGSLLVMAGSVQKYYSHAIPKQLEPCGCRHSLTFRQYYPEALAIPQT